MTYNCCSNYLEARNADFPFVIECTISTALVAASSKTNFRELLPIKAEILNTLGYFMLLKPNKHNTEGWSDCEVKSLGSKYVMDGNRTRDLNGVINRTEVVMFCGPYVDLGRDCAYNNRSAAHQLSMVKLKRREIEVFDNKMVS